MLKDANTPIVKLYPEILNRSVFLNQKHPEYNPVLDRDRYIQYWDEEYKRCIEGLWGKEKKKCWRWMNPDLYHYVNHWTIKHTREGATAEVAIKPYCRDTEWIMSVFWTVCGGYSGFTEDDEYNGHHLLKKYYQQKNEEIDKYGRPIELTGIEVRKLEKSPWVRNSKGNYKRYMDPVDLIKRTYEEPKGLPIYENIIKDLFILGSRGVGKSNFFSSVIGREFVFNGRRYYKTNLFEHGGEIGSVFAGAEPKDKIDSLYDKVFFGLDNYSGSYEDVNNSYPSPFYKFRKGSFNTDTVVRHEYQIYYPDGGSGKRGSGSQMHKGVFRNDPDAAVGERKNIIVVEEAGLAAKLLLIHANNQNVLIRNGRKVGRSGYIGTGGNIQKIHGAKKLFNAPEENGFLSMPNEWDKGQAIGIFIPVEYTLQDFKDPQGNTMYEEARTFQMGKRLELSQGKDSTAFTRNRMFEPIRPADMFLSSDNIIFDQGRLSSRLAELAGVDDWRVEASFGELKRYSNSPEGVAPVFKAFAEATPIISRDIDESAGKRGSIVFHRHPPENSIFRMRGSRFRSTYDPIKMEGDGPSFGSILVIDTKYDDIAAEFIGRRDSPEEIHDIALSMALYYNCPLFPELNIQGFLKYARKEGLSHILYPTPMNAISKTTKNPKVRFGEVGVIMTAQMKKGAALQAQTLMNKIGEDGLDLYGKIQSTRLLEEMEVWDGKENADHISSFLLQALWEEEESDISQGKEENIEEQYQNFRKALENNSINLQKEVYNSWLAN